MIKMTVENMYSGGVVERIHEEIARVLANIADPNTPAKKARKVKMEMTIKPNEHRNMAEVIVSTSSAICAPEPIETSIFIGHDPRTGEIDASEIPPGENPAQHQLPDVPQSGKITHINTAKAAN